MMKAKLKKIIKYFSFIYAIYYCLGTFFLILVRQFVKVDSKKVLFMSFGGKGFSDSPQAIYTQMKIDPYFEDYQLVWAFEQPQKILEIPNNQKVKVDTWAFFKTALSAGIWITNSSVERGLSFKNKKTFYLNTWHGTPMKKMGSDVDGENKSFKGKAKLKVDAFLAQSQFEMEIFSRVFEIPKGNFYLFGLPRNDELVHPTTSVQDLKKKLNIPVDKKIILYAPTFREYDRGPDGTVQLKSPLDLTLWENELGSDYILLIRAHYEVSQNLMAQLGKSEFIREVSNYPNLNELMLLSDLLISDYSSVFFDYSLLGKPMFQFTYDFERYEKERGLYFDIRKWLSGSANQSELIELIQHSEEELFRQKTLKFQKKYVSFAGDATNQCLQLLKTMK